MIEVSKKALGISGNKVSTWNFISYSKIQRCNSSIVFFLISTLPINSFLKGISADF
jgi:hypothetical protein